MVPLRPIATGDEPPSTKVNNHTDGQLAAMQQRCHVTCAVARFAYANKALSFRPNPEGYVKSIRRINSAKAWTPGDAEPNAARTLA